MLFVITRIFVSGAVSTLLLSAIFNYLYLTNSISFDSSEDQFLIIDTIYLVNNTPRPIELGYEYAM